MIIGVDMDGILCNFNKAFRLKFIELTGKDLIPEQKVSGNTIETTPPCWNYAVDAYGHTKEEDRKVWNDICSSPTFWETLHDYPEADSLLKTLGEAVFRGHEVYFVTTRNGNRVHEQCCDWLMNHGYEHPQVIIARKSKGMIAYSTAMTHFIDDKPENCLGVIDARPRTHVYMPLTDYNNKVSWHPHIKRIVSISEFEKDIRDAL